MMRRALASAALLLAALLPCHAAAREGSPPSEPSASEPERPALTEMVAVVHLHTSLVDGASSPRRLAALARASGIDALVITDHLLERMTYDPLGLRPLLQISWSRPAVLSLGMGAYFEALDRAEEESPGIVIVPGVEVTPYARWRGSIVSGDLRLEGWHRHLLVLGIDEPTVFERLPMAGNPRGGDFTPRALLALLPLAIVLAGGRALRRLTRCAPRTPLRSLSSPRGIAWGGAALAALLVLWSAFPFRVERFPPDGPDPGAAPFERLIARVRDRGGISIWAHPEAAASREALGGIEMDTASYAGLVRTARADAFGALPEGIKTLLPAGGLWDQSLNDGLRGSAPGAPWALAESDEHGSAREIDFGALQTVFWVKERTRFGLLEALKAGRFYGRWTPRGASPLRLRVFRIEADGRSAGSGEALRAEGPVSVRLRIEGGDGGAVSARLVRGGGVIWSRRGTTPIDAAVTDTPSSTTYYRLDVEGAYPYRLIGNPVVLRRGQEGA